MNCGLPWLPWAVWTHKETPFVVRLCHFAAVPLNAEFSLSQHNLLPLFVPFASSTRGLPRCFVQGTQGEERGAARGLHQRPRLGVLVPVQPLLTAGQLFLQAILLVTAQLARLRVRPATHTRHQDQLNPLNACTPLGIKAVLVSLSLPPKKNPFFGVVTGKVVCKRNLSCLKMS